MSKLSIYFIDCKLKKTEKNVTVSADRLGRSFTLKSLLAIHSQTLVWVVSPLLGWGHFGVEPFGMFCALDWHRPSLSYVSCIFVFCFWIPVCIMIFCYGNIVARVYKAKRSTVTPLSQLDIYITKVNMILKQL